MSRGLEKAAVRGGSILGRGQYTHRDPGGSAFPANCGLPGSTPVSALRPGAIVAASLGRNAEPERSRSTTVDQALPEDLTRIWQRVRDEVRASLPPSTYKLWLEPLRPLSIDGTRLYVTGPARVRTWVERRYAHRLEAALRQHTDSVRAVVFVGDRRRAGSPRPAPHVAAES